MIKMKRLLVVVDMQNDFIDGSLGTKEAKKIVDNVVAKIQSYEQNHDEVVYTLDTHDEDYLRSQEGRNLPVIHCIKGEKGWLLHNKIEENSNKNKKCFEKGIFGSFDLANYIQQGNYNQIELIGVCSDICVISNALIVKSFIPELKIKVDASCCAGVTVEKHLAALEVMKSCQIDVINE